MPPKRAVPERVREDSQRFRPLPVGNCLRNKKGHLRIADTEEREAIMGFPVGYTQSEHGSVAFNDQRLTVIGNSWNVGVVIWLQPLCGGYSGWCLSKGKTCSCRARLKPA